MDLNEIDKIITQQIEKLKKEIQLAELTEVCTFKLNDESLSQIPWLELQHSGIYMFDVEVDDPSKPYQEWIENLKSIWEHEDYRTRSTPNTRRGRIDAHQNLGSWIPLYLGKALKVERRVREHIYLELDKPTFALKLLGRKNISHWTFRIKTLKVDVDSYHQIVPIIESELRNRFNPILGRQ